MAFNHIAVGAWAGLPAARVAVIRPTFRLRLLLSCLPELVSLLLEFLGQAADAVNLIPANGLAQVANVAFDVAAQLAHYTPEAVRLYGRYSGIDFPFPFLVALFWAALAIWGLRRARPDVFASGDWRHWVPWCFLGCVCDWIENVANAWVIGRYPPLHGGVATLAVLAKYGKLVAVGITAVIAIAFALWGAYTSISRYVQRRAT